MAETDNRGESQNSGEEVAMIHNTHPVHGLLLGGAMYYVGYSMRTSAMVGGAAALYMMRFGHAAPSGY